MASDALTGSWLGQYQVLERLGEGGMARVYKGLHQQLNRHVALKIILPEAAERSGFKERFKREANLIAQLQHANIVTVYDFGETHNLSYLVMQYVGGGTLSSKLWRGQPLSPTLAANYGVQMARALQHAHSQGIIHRDIKPSNMLLDEKDSNHLLLSDFGIAKLLSSPSDSDLARRATAADPLTLEGSVLGTPEFMSPEQALGGAIDARADIYSLGMVLYFLLVGRHPFPPTNQLRMLYHQVYTIPPSASDINPSIPPMLAEVVDQAIAKRPEERFQSAEAFARALESVLAFAPTSLLTDSPTLDILPVSEGVSSGPQAPSLGTLPMAAEQTPAHKGSSGPGASQLTVMPSSLPGAPPSIMLPIPPPDTVVTVLINQSTPAGPLTLGEVPTPSGLQVTIMTKRQIGPDEQTALGGTSSQPARGPTILVPGSGPPSGASEPSTASTPGRAGAFISYSHRDGRYLEQLQTHLAYYARRGAVDYWDATKIQAGANWRKEVERAVGTTKVAVLLVSADFLASDFIAKNELPPLLAEAEKGGALILPVIISACVFEDTELAQFQALNPPSRPFIAMSRHQQQVLWTKIAKKIMLEGK